MAFPQFHATHFAGLSVTPDTLTRAHSLYFLLVLIAISTRTSLEPFQNGIRYRSMFNPKHLLFLFVLPSYKFVDQLKIISEPWHSGSNGHYVHRWILAEEPNNHRTEVYTKHIAQNAYIVRVSLCIVSVFVYRTIPTHADFSTRCIWESSGCTKLRCFCTTGQWGSRTGDVTSLTLNSLHKLYRHLLASTVLSKYVAVFFRWQCRILWPISTTFEAF